MSFCLKLSESLSLSVLLIQTHRAPPHIHTHKEADIHKHMHRDFLWVHILSLSACLLNIWWGAPLSWGDLQQEQGRLELWHAFCFDHYLGLFPWTSCPLSLYLSQDWFWRFTSELFTKMAQNISMSGGWKVEKRNNSSLASCLCIISNWMRANTPHMGVKLKLTCLTVVSPLHSSLCQCLVENNF